MKSSFYLFLFPVIILSFFLISGLIKSNDTDELSKKLLKYEGMLAKTRSNQQLENFFSSDLNTGLEEWQSWSKLAKKSMNFWNDYLNSKENLHINHEMKTSSSISTEINKLISYLNRSCKNKNVSFIKIQSSDSSLFNQETSPEKSFGFGLSAYDGFWPSFNKLEANTICIQSKIIKELTEYLIDSFSGEPFTIISLKRESVGDIDASHIHDDLFSTENSTPLLRRKGLIESYLFEISFSGKTTHCRSFINQLRPPYSLRKLEVSRHEKSVSYSDDSFFTSSNSKSVSEILPIIRDINSNFTLEIEYIFQVSNNLKQWLSTELKDVKNLSRTQEFLSQLD